MGQMDNNDTDSDLYPADRIPAMGSMVWFYFQHAFWRGGQLTEGPSIEPLFSGRTEMRCRPARVLEVVTTTRISANRSGVIDVWLTLEVEFDDEDRRHANGGIVCRYDRVQHAAPSLGPGGPGSLGLAWPPEGHWAFEAKTD